MNLDDLQKTWARQTVAGPRVDLAPLRVSLAREVRQRRRSVRRIIGVAVFVLVTGWSVVLAAHFTGIKPLNALTLLSFLTVSAFDLVCLAGALRVLRRMKQEELGMGGTLAEALHASLQAVTRQMRDCRLFGWALAIEFTAELGGTLLFYWTRNLHGRGTVAKVVMLVLLITAIVMTLRRYYRRQLVPRRAELQRELATLQNDPR